MTLCFLLRNISAYVRPIGSYSSVGMHAAPLGGQAALEGWLWSMSTHITCHISEVVSNILCLTSIILDCLVRTFKLNFIDRLSYGIFLLDFKVGCCFSIRYRSNQHRFCHSQGMKHGADAIGLHLRHKKEFYRACYMEAGCLNFTPRYIVF